MKYANGQIIKLGDEVFVEKNVRGIVVCDFDTGECAEEYSTWDPNVELVGGGTLSCGVLIKTEELGLLHYTIEDEGIQYIKQTKIILDTPALSC